MERNNNSFEYTYSAPQQEEIKKIREKYMPREENKMDYLRRLDRSAARKGTTVSLIVGILGTLILGSGMSMCMVGDSSMMIPGIIVGVLGMIPVALAYPIYTRITKKEREKIAPEILRLTEELMK